MVLVKQVAFFSTLVLTVLVALVISRITKPRACNSHPSIVDLSLFSEGKLKKVDNCSWLSDGLYSLEPKTWTLDELEAIDHVLQLKKLESKVVVTIDLMNRKKLRSILNYFWIGKNYIYQPEDLGEWLYQQSFQAYSNPSESLSTSRILNALSGKVYSNNNQEFNWSQILKIEKLHLSQLMLNKKDYCSEFFISLNFVESCRFTEESDKKLFTPAIESLVSSVLADYISGLEIKPKLQFIEALKTQRNRVSVPELKLNKSSYSELVMSTGKYCAELLKVLVKQHVINQKDLARVINQRTLFSNKGLLVVDGREPVKVTVTETENKYLRTNLAGNLLSFSGESLDIQIKDFLFNSQVFLGPKLKLDLPIFNKSKFVYIVSGSVNLQDLLNVGVQGYLLNNPQQHYALLHTPSMKLAGLSFINLQNIEDLKTTLGWKSKRWSEKSKSVVPKAKIDGVLRYRLANSR